MEEAHNFLLGAVQELYDDNGARIPAIKKVKDATGLDLDECKELLEEFKETLKKRKAEEKKQKTEAAKASSPEAAKSEAGEPAKRPRTEPEQWHDNQRVSG